jgi:hypothetical protein
VYYWSEHAVPNWLSNLHWRLCSVEFVSLLDGRLLRRGKCWNNAAGNIPVHRLRCSFCFISFLSPYLFYLLTVGVEVVYFRLITLRHTPQSVGLLWTRDRPVAETSTWQRKHSLETNIHAPGGIRIHDPSKRSAAVLHLRPHGHWDRHMHINQSK